MTIEVVRDMLAWCTVIDYVILVIWFFFIVLAHDWMYRIHSKWYKISREKFDEIHYAGIALFKICIVLFNLAPYLALRLFL
jgi:hypothetical protein